MTGDSVVLVLVSRRPRLVLPVLGLFAFLRLSLSVSLSLSSHFAVPLYLVPSSPSPTCPCLSIPIPIPTPTPTHSGNPPFSPCHPTTCLLLRLAHPGPNFSSSHINLSLALMTTSATRLI